MKKSNFLVVALMAVAVCVGFASCGDDDDEPSGGGGSKALFDASKLIGTWESSDGSYYMEFKADGRYIGGEPNSDYPDVYVYSTDTQKGIVTVSDIRSTWSEDVEVTALTGQTLTLTFKEDGEEDEVETYKRYNGTKKPWTIDGYEFVNLGLSVKWASANVGASPSFDSGKYFQYGNPSTSRSAWKSDNYSLPMSDISGTSNDPATASMGGNWQLPTLEEMEELYSKCDWYLQTISGTRYWLVVQRGKDSNFIFLPFAGAYPLGTSNNSLLYDNYQCWLMTGTYNSSTRGPWILKGRYTNETTSPDVNITTNEVQAISAMTVRAVSTASGDVKW